ncbi:MAG: hypothetical protein BEN19_05395 [Epulopiscium sp. Nuni2H_MBin003]|nr:MAG: hypothetical protein BEN19_05395 [Epulopiscium sp. Nuni2H_MBin003]
MDINFLNRKSKVALKLEDLFSRFGFDKYTMNRFETYAFYLENEKFLADSRVITLQGAGGKILALKPDVTMSIVKNYNMLGMNKIYYNEPIFKVPHGENEFREIHQIGIEYIGELDTYQTVEVLNLAVKSLKMIGEDYRLCISQVGIIRKILHKLELSSVETIIKYLRQKNIHDLSAYLEKIGKQSYIKIFEILISINGDFKTSINQLLEEDLFKEYNTYLEELYNIAQILEEVVDYKKISFDFNHISSTEYYNDLIFTGYVKGISTPILSGGRYDNLLYKMDIKDKSALGFAVNLSEINKLEDTRAVLRKKIVNDKSPLEMIQEANRLFEAGESFVVIRKDE